MGRPVDVLITFDVEDNWFPPEELGDEIVRWIAHTLTEYKLKANFLLVGDKFRRIKKFNLKELVKVLEFHGIGLHTNSQISHPFLPEMVENCSWEEGVKRVLKDEEEGIKILKEVTGRDAEAISQHGVNTAGAFHFEVARKLNLPLIYGGFQIEGGDTPLIINGVLSTDYRCPFTYATVHDYAYKDEGSYISELLRADEHIKMLYNKGHPFLNLFCGHPYCLRSRSFHVINYHSPNGRNIRSIKQTLNIWGKGKLFPKRHLEKEVKPRFITTCQWLSKLQEEGKIRLITFKEFVQIYWHRRERIYIEELFNYAVDIIKSSPHMPIHPYFTPGEMLISMIKMLIFFQKNKFFPPYILRPEVRFPLEEPCMAAEVPKLSWKNFSQIIKQINKYVEEKGRLPGNITFSNNNLRIGLGQIMYGLSTCLITAYNGNLPKEIEFPIVMDKYPGNKLASKIDSFFSTWHQTPYLKPQLNIDSVSRYTRLMTWDIVPAHPKLFYTY